jgi:hypothetical protein
MSQRRYLLFFFVIWIGLIQFETGEFMTDGSDRGRFFIYTLILATLAFSALTVIGKKII